MYSYAAFSRGASGLLDTMIHCMRGIVSQMGGFSGPIGYSAVLVQEPGARSQEQGAGSREQQWDGTWLLLQTLFGRLLLSP